MRGKSPPVARPSGGVRRGTKRGRDDKHKGGNGMTKNHLGNISKCPRPIPALRAWTPIEILLFDLKEFAGKQPVDFNNPT